MMLDQMLYKLLIPFKKIRININPYSKIFKILSLIRSFYLWNSIMTIPSTSLLIISKIMLIFGILEKIFMIINKIFFNSHGHKFKFKRRRSKLMYFLTKH